MFLAQENSAVVVRRTTTETNRHGGPWAVEKTLYNATFDCLPSLSGENMDLEFESELEAVVNLLEAVQRKIDHQTAAYDSM